MQSEQQRALRNTIPDAIARAVRRSPDKTAIRSGGRSWSFRQLDDATARVAGALAQWGLRPGDRVAAFGKNSDAYVLLWLACLRSGLVHVPVNFSMTRAEAEYLVTQSGASAIFFDAALAERVDGLPCKVRGTLHGGDRRTDILAAAADGPAVPVSDTLAESTPAQILYTSGTTSAPKGAVLTHRALLAEYVSTIAACDIRASDYSLAALPLYHSAQMHVFLMPLLLCGGTTLIADSPEPGYCLRTIHAERITSFFAPPTVWIALLRHAEFDPARLGALTKAYYGASIMPVPVLLELQQKLPKLRFYNCYGQSEIGPLATVLGPDEHAARPASAGRPVLNVETRIVDETLQDVPPGELGEIVHRSPQLLTHYWDKPEQTAEAFAGGWFHSGDLGYMDAEGYLYVVDRIKDVINSGGVLVSSREVEECLYTHGAVAEAAVFALPHPKWVEAVTACVVRKRGHDDATEEALIAHARQALATFKVPKRIVFVADLPRNTAGKLLKRQLREDYAQLFGAD
ncbi:Acyl-CoA synthetase (AMP-forming)/AMP-acid ligase II [Cupriavidus taiwanensis]|uniref:acyl-CoA synthetase n=1 Tax=Cupriavidus taiwanensis TaxID=164546 RepID=UPI000E191535|nr:acyl-CoA synthetase [Cupriavidus taiwanensis]SOZ19007.1 Acyl-CoA synthetase (AMP-forming)/AMP-acid ligase II [Cupriavidus taiwanensis]SOZ32152.1 Acyl-CoA synthetase (AMP-forming)/AMP-acid ligase II [Cupriavidus taiwanensis]SOZ47757.1 Acyl-CoA synthetase (AMP-forming)/AMP-acid ligase II [Cupriavidus taiwanensis]